MARPKQYHGKRVPKQIRLLEPLVERLEVEADRRDIGFNKAMEHAAELWLAYREGQPFSPASPLLIFLQKFCEEDLEQWVDWRLPTKDGEVYVTISRVPHPGTVSEQYDDLSRLFEG